MGHVRGGYKTVLANAALKLDEHRVNIKCGCAARKVQRSDDELLVHTESGESARAFTFDRVLLAVPGSQL